MRINRRIASLLGSTTLAITARAKELKAEGHDVVNFAGGEPDFDTPDFIKKAAVAALDQGLTKYTPSTGMLPLKETIVEKFQKDNQLVYKPAEIAVSCGAKHSIFNIIQVLADEGDEILIPAPYWVSYPEMVKLSGATSKVLETSLDTNFKITAEQLKQSVSKNSRILILNSPSNPTGSVYSKEELAAIAKICVENEIYVISDEIYEKLIYDVPKYTSIASLGDDIKNLTITVNGVSKAYSMTGWRIGYAAGPQEVMDYVKKFQDHSTSNPASISQAAAMEALKAPAESVDAMREQFHQRRDLMMSCFDKIPEISYFKPEGAFYLFCNISQLGESADVAQRILNDAKVAFIPGEGFGAPGYARLSFSTSTERIEEGTGRIASWVQNQAAKV